MLNKQRFNFYYPPQDTISKISSIRIIVFHIKNPTLDPTLDPSLSIKAICLSRPSHSPTDKAIINIMKTKTLRSNIILFITVSIMWFFPNNSTDETILLNVLFSFCILRWLKLDWAKCIAVCCCMTEEALRGCYTKGTCRIKIIGNLSFAQFSNNFDKFSFFYWMTELNTRWCMLESEPEDFLQYSFQFPSLQSAVCLRASRVGCIGTQFLRFKRMNLAASPVVFTVSRWYKYSKTIFSM